MNPRNHQKVPENYYNLFKPEGCWSNKCKWWRHITHHTDILSKVDAHSGTHVDLASQLQLSLPALNIQVKKNKQLTKATSTLGLSQSNQNHWKICCWRKWNVFLMHGSSKDVKVIFLWLALLSRRRPCTSPAQVSVVEKAGKSWVCYQK